MKRNSPIGKRFYRLVVLKHSVRKNYVTCQCDCGTIKDIHSSNLTERGGVRSCGCLRREQSLIWMTGYDGELPIDPTKEKICRKCLQAKPLEVFWKHKIIKDGRHHWCSDCCHTYRQKPDQLSKKKQRYLVQKAEGTTWGQLHPEEKRQNDREWWAAHPEETRAYREEHKEKRAQQSAEWEAAHPDSNRERGQRRRAAQANAPVNDFSHAQWVEIQAIQNHRCYYCQKRCKGHLTIDHVLALSKGGSHTASNIVAACGSCNSGKKDKKPPTTVQLLLITEAPPRKPRKDRRKKSEEAAD